MNNQQIASMIDHTYLKPNATSADIEQLCREAAEHQFYSVCVNGAWVPKCRELLAGTGVGISAVVGFPLGAAPSFAKAQEAAYCAQQGATEIDMVLSIGHLLEGDLAYVTEDIRAVVQATAGQARVKVIMETGFLTDEQKIAACRCSAEAGAHFVKTSTGFGPGGATVEDVRLMRANVPATMEVKASGGVRDAQTALRMIEAGATRLGTSSGVAIMNGVQDSSTY